MPLTDPVPSSAFDVLERNIQDTDKFVNQESGTFTNRVGKAIKPIPVIEAEANAAIASLGWDPAGEFAAGFTYTKLNDVGRDALGSWWRYNGSDLPKVISAGTVPSSPDFSVISFEAADNVSNSSGGSVQEFIDKAEVVLVNRTNQGFSRASPTLDETYLSKADCGNDIRIIESVAAGGLSISGGRFNNPLSLNSEIRSESVANISDLAVANAAEKRVSRIAGESTYNVNGYISDTVERIAKSGTSIVTDNNSGLIFYQSGVTDARSCSIESLATSRLKSDSLLGSIVESSMQGNLSRELRVVVIGDSISVGPDYKSKSVYAGGESIDGVDNLHFSGGLSRVITESILSAVPTSTPISLYFRAAAGESTDRLNVNYENLSGAWWGGREQVAIGKTWIDCVFDLQPDLIILSTGMNDTNETFLTGFNILTAKIAATSSHKKPHVAILTTPNPNYLNDTLYDFRVFALNAEKIHLAQTQRAVAHSNNYSLIDVAALNSAVRYGVDYRTFNHGGFGAPIFAVGSVVAIPASELGKPFQSYRINLADMSAGADIRIGRSFSVALAIQITSSGLITVYEIASPYYVGRTATKQLDISAVGVENVEVLNTSKLLTIRVNQKTVITIPAPISIPAGVVAISGGSLVSVQLADPVIKRCGGGSATMNDYYGYVDNSLNKYGGGINHPSLTMLNEIYAPPVYDFFKYLMSKTYRSNAIKNTGSTTSLWTHVGTVTGPQFYRRLSGTNDAGINFEITLDSNGDISSGTKSSGLEVRWDKANGNVYMLIGGAAGLVYFRTSGFDFTSCQAVANGDIGGVGL